MANKIKYLKFEPRKVMKKEEARLKTLLIERIRVGAFNDLYTADMRRAENTNICNSCGAYIGDYHNDNCPQEMCPRCGELCGHCNCTREYAVYPTEFISPEVQTTDYDEIFNKVMSILGSRIDTIENKLGAIENANPLLFAPFPRLELQDPIYLTSRDGKRDPHAEPHVARKYRLD